MRYRAKVVGHSAEVLELQLDAATADDARRQVEEQGLRLLALRTAHAWPRLAARQTPFPLLLFSQELATLLNAGLALIDALESLAEKEHAAGPRKVLTTLVRQLYEGKALSQALAQHPEVFPALYVALVQSGEKTGAVGEALSRYVSYRQRLDALRQRVLSASVYPLLLLLVGGGVLLFLLGYVVPRFSLVFEGLDTELPWLSQQLMQTGLYLHEHRAGLLLSLVAGLTALYLLGRQLVRRRLLGHWLAAIPALQRRIMLYELARFYRALGILLQGGIPILSALEMARGLLGGPARLRLDQACARVREGLTLSRALEQQQLTTPVSLRMLHAGEQAGNLGHMMERTADFYDEDISRWFDWFVRLFEPLLMAFIGLIIGVIVVLMYIPIFELASSIQ